MLFLFADEELKSKQTLLNGTDSALFQLASLILCPIEKHSKSLKLSLESSKKHQ